MAQQDLWRRIGLVPQKSFLFSGTVADNLRYGDEEATDEELWHYLEIAQGREFVEEMPEQLEAPVSQGGANVSGGQRQRLAIARALAKQAKIQIYDDSFSALDFTTDARLRAALRKQTADATVIIVAQRVGTIMHADQIIVLERRHDRRHRHARRAARDQRDLPRDRRLPARRGGRGMSAAENKAQAAAIPAPSAAARRAAPGGPGPGGPGGHALVMPTAKAKDFAARCAASPASSRPERALLIVVVLLAVVSVTFAVVGPKILGHATNIIFEGVVSKQIPAGVTQAQAVAGLRAKGQSRIADMLSGMTLHPGHGVDFAALARTLLLLVAVYLLSALFAWLQGYIMAGVAQRTIYRLRQEADEKLARLPLKYFDDHPRGDVLSRMTNDIDNISQSLQQSLTQIITSTLTIIGVLIMMLSISWLLALISVLVVPDLGGHHDAHRQALAEAVRGAVGAHRRPQRPRGGDVHRPQRGQGVRPPAGRPSTRSTSRTRSSTRPASRPSSSPGSSCR